MQARHPNQLLSMRFFLLSHLSKVKIHTTNSIGHADRFLKRLSLSDFLGQLPVAAKSISAERAILYSALILQFSPANKHSCPRLHRYLLAVEVAGLLPEFNKGSRKVRVGNGAFWLFKLRKYHHSFIDLSNPHCR